MAGRYDQIKTLARKKREEFGVTTAGLNLQVMRAVYKKAGIALDLRKLSPRVRALYMCDDNDPSVLVNSNLPREPRLFAMAHELKHHLCDRPALESGEIRCGDYNRNKDIEIAAEVFAAEFVYPEAEFAELLASMGLTTAPLTEVDVVRIKRALSAPVSYKFITKRLEVLNLVPRGKYATVKFKSLEEQIHGVPFYKEPWFRAQRSRRAAQR